MRNTAILAVAAILVGAAVLVWVWPLRTSSGEAATIARGRQLYADNCAGCHGANLEGQPNWKAPLPSGRLPAPPHNATGHTWHHPDGILFRITKEGPAAVVGDGYESNMPGFGAMLSDGEIRAILAYIRNTWPERERAYQAEISRREKENTQ